MKRKTLFSKYIILLLLLLLHAIPSVTVAAADLRYDYDELGRLIRSVSGDTTVIYTYDSAGNILGITVDNVAPSIPVGDLNLSSLRCGDTIEVVLSGEQLEGTRVASSDSALEISNLKYTDTGISFTLTANCENALGVQSLTLSNAAGSSTIELSVDPELPMVYLTPAPLAVPPDGSERSFLLRLSHADNVAHTFSLQSSDPSTFSISSTTLYLEAGQIEVSGRLTGHQSGLAYLEIVSSTLGTTRVPVFVTADFRGVNTSLALPMGVDKDINEGEPSPTERLLVGQATLGVSRGDAIYGINPDVLTVGGGTYQVLVDGTGLDGVASAEVIPQDGLTINGLTPSAQGDSLYLSISVTENAPPSVRQIVLKNSGEVPYLPVRPGADRLRIALPLPEIDSISPVVAYPGDTAIPITLRGQRLNDAISVRAVPPEGITFSSNLSIDTAGTVLTTQMTLAPDMVPGDRVIVVTTPSGDSTNVPLAANTLHVALDSQGDIDNLVSSEVGLLKEVVDEPQNQWTLVPPSLVGVTKGAVLTSITPNAGVIGTTVLVTIAGQNLSPVDTVSFEPSDGLLVSAVNAAPDGGSVTFQVDIAEDAPETLREVRVSAGGQRIHPVEGNANRFRVTPPAPQVYAVSPLYLLTGSDSASLTIYGENMQNGLLQITPQNGIAVGSVVVSADGRVMSATLAISSQANTGERLVQIVTPGGQTTAVNTPANTIRLVTDGGVDYPNLSSAAIGIVKTPPDSPAPQEITPMLATPVGVYKESAPDNRSNTVAPITASVGVAKGRLVTRMTPKESLPGRELDVVLQGSELQSVVSVSFNPADGISIIQGPTINAEGTEAVMRLAIAAEASPTPRNISLLDANGFSVPFANLNEAQLRIGYGQPEILSIEPILAGRGDIFTLIVRGNNLFDASVVTAEPGEGIYIGNRITVNETGTELTVSMAVDPNAPVGSHMIRVTVPGAVTTDIADPANTFTVYESVPQ